VGFFIGASAITSRRLADLRGFTDADLDDAVRVVV
jgi:hypothetical protein